MSTDNLNKDGKPRRKPPTERLHLVVKRSVFAQIVQAAALDDESVSGFIARAAAAAAEKVLAERGLCSGCLRPHAAPNTAAA